MQPLRAKSRFDAASLEVTDLRARRWMGVLLVLSLAGVLAHRLPLIQETRLRLMDPVNPALAVVAAIRHELYLLVNRERADREVRALAAHATSAYRGGELERLRRELAALREQAGLALPSSGTGMIATVIAKPMDGVQGRLTIDRGEKDGVRKGGAVIANSGGALSVVGVIDEISDRSSTVRTVLDPSCRIAVTVGKSGTVDVYAGAGPGSAGGRIEYVEGSRVVRAGDAVITASTSSLFPAGIPVGEVIGSRTDGDGNQEVAVRPLSARSELYYVWVLGEAS